VRAHRRGRFLGETGLLSGEPSFLTAVLHEPGSVVVVSASRDLHDRLFESMTGLADETLVRPAAEIGLDVQRFVADLAAHRYLDRIREDMSSGARSGVNGTSTFFVGGVRHDGPRDVVSLIAALQRSATAYSVCDPSRPDRMTLVMLEPTIGTSSPTSLAAAPRTPRPPSRVRAGRQ